MRYVDFSIQTLLLACAVVLFLITMGQQDWLMIILAAQAVLGMWQLSSSFISVLLRAELRRLKIIHLVLSLFYLLILWIVGSASPEIPRLGYALLFTIPAWSLAIYYYVITWRWAFRKRVKRGSFLPHVSF